MLARSFQQTGAASANNEMLPQPPMPTSRRKFLQLSSLAGASLFLPKFLKAIPPMAAPVPRSAGGKILVILQLSGGNDGLNTIIPVRNDSYYRARPGLAIPRREALLLNDETGLHPALKGLKALYDAGAASFIQGVGYPGPVRSHARSAQIWHTASGSGEVWPTGWIGRYLDETARNEAALAIDLDDAPGRALLGHRQRAGVLADLPAGRHAVPSGTSYPDTALAGRLRAIAARIGAGAATRVYHVSQGSYDTHVAQAGRQAQLFRELDGALAAFTADLKKSGHFGEVLVLAYSEFGRRVAENEFGGTDHGTAGPVLLLGGALPKPGLANPAPSLENLDAGDLRYSVDFRSIYAGVLEHWLGADAEKILGRKFTPYPGAF